MEIKFQQKNSWKPVRSYLNYSIWLWNVFKGNTSDTTGHCKGEEGGVSPCSFLVSHLSLASSRPGVPLSTGSSLERSLIVLFFPIHTHTHRFLFSLTFSLTLGTYSSYEDFPNFQYLLKHLFDLRAAGHIPHSI